VSEHISVGELADAAEGLLDSGRAAVVTAHLAQCPDCHAAASALRKVTELLASDPAPPMPADIANRLDAALAAENERRTLTGLLDDRALPRGPRQPKPSLGSFGSDLPKRSLRRLVLPAMVAAAAAAVVGFAGYVVSASAGLNEPPTSASVVDPKRLGSEAKSIESSQELSPHRYSRAWQCARTVTTGRITALTLVTVDGVPALLVYTRDDSLSYATIVTGCAVDRPSAGPSAMLPR
jgi:anti-sigma factor RsiW